MANNSNFGYNFYPDNKLLSIDFTAHLAHFMSLSYLDNHEFILQ